MAKGEKSIGRDPKVGIREQSFGEKPSSPKLSKGGVYHAFGLKRDGLVVPKVGAVESPNSKTAYPSALVSL